MASSYQLTELARHALRAAMVGPRSQGWFASLLETIAEIDAVAASYSPSPQHSTIAAHLHHTVFCLRLVRLRLSGEATPDWDEEWAIRTVDDAQWNALIADATSEYEHFMDTSTTPAPDSGEHAEAITDQALHVAYHVGAIRQMLVRMPKP
jgi:hypothetical protein